MLAIFAVLGFRSTNELILIYQRDEAGAKLFVIENIMTRICRLVNRIFSTPDMYPLLHHLPISRNQDSVHYHLLQQQYRC